MDLTKQQATKIKQMIVDGVKQAIIAADFGISRSLVSDIATNRAHADVAWPDGYRPKAAGGQRKRDTHDPTDSRVIDLEAEVEHLHGELAFERKRVKANSKAAGLFTAICEEMDSKIKPFKALPDARKPSRGKALVEEHVVMHISDGHHDQIVTPEACCGLENYDFRISCARAERYVNTTLQWTQETLSNFSFPHLTILNYGDSTCGEIHNAVQRSYFRNQFKNSFAIGQLYALMYRDLAPHFESVTVLCLPGNHGRRSQKKDYNGSHDNWDYLVSEVARMHCRDLANVQFLIPDAFTANIEINGHWMNVSHGDDVKGNGGVPFYGMMRRQKNMIALSGVSNLPRVRYFVMGHHHVNASLADVEGEMITNGAWLGTDAYAFNALAGYREPTQLLHGMHLKHGVSWRLPVKLRFDGEQAGPKRYKIPGAKFVGPLVE